MLSTNTYNIAPKTQYSKQSSMVFFPFWSSSVFLCVSFAQYFWTVIVFCTFRLRQRRDNNRPDRWLKVFLCTETLWDSRSKNVSCVTQSHGMSRDSGGYTSQCNRSLVNKLLSYRGIRNFETAKSENSRDRRIGRRIRFHITLALSPYLSSAWRQREHSPTVLLTWSTGDEV